MFEIPIIEKTPAQTDLRFGCRGVVYVVANQGLGRGFPDPDEQNIINLHPAGMKHQMYRLTI